MPSAASLMTENPTAVHFLHPPSSLPMGNNLSDLPSPSSHVREIQKLLLPLMLAQEKKQGLKIEVFVPVAIEIIKKDNLSFREQTTQDQLGRQATSVQTDMKKVKAAVSLYAFVQFNGLINCKEPVILSVVGKMKAVDDSPTEAGFKEVFREQRHMKYYIVLISLKRYFRCILLYSS